MRKKDTPFRPSKQETKADRTDRAARAIIDAEEQAHRAKTERLRRLRIEKEAAGKSGAVKEQT